MDNKGITKLSVGGFKSIGEETTLDIKPLTLLGGANSSGKSSFMQPLLMLKQTLEVTYEPGLPLVLDGGNVKFTSVDQFFTKIGGDTPEKFSVGVYSSTHWFKTVFGKTEQENKRLVVESNEFPDPLTKTDVVIRASMTEEEMQKVCKNSRLAGVAHRYEPTFADFYIANVKFFLGICRNSKDSCARFSAEYGWNVENIVYAIHLPGLRGNPERAYTAKGTGPRFPGIFDGHYAASIIENWESTKNTKKLETLCRHLEMLGLTSKITARRINAVAIEVLVNRLPKNGRSKTDMVNIVDVGFGVSQIFPVLVALLVAEPGQLVYFEQPEIHLHPKAQKALASVLVDAANRGVKVVAETHSSMLLLAVQTLIAKGEANGGIDHNNVAMHWFERDKDGMSKVSTAELDDAGRFGKWPVDFGKEELGAGGEYLDAVAKRKSVK